MKKVVSLTLSIILMFSFFIFDTSALNDEDFVPYVVDFSLTSDFADIANNENNTRATGLILSYSIYLTKTGSTLNITGQTHGSMEVVKCGFKDLTVQRRKSSSYDWEDYYEYGNVYADTWMANLDTTLVVPANYQYRITCKHYAKKNLLMVQTVSNTSNIVTTV
ncbi:MAG: hypothetical protein UHM85_10945 [Acutalibacteraceae bacterium]|nr:hypothetical protein [Acutalibacteraceae bacterium]